MKYTCLKIILFFFLCKFNYAPADVEDFDNSLTQQYILQEELEDKIIHRDPSLEFNRDYIAISLGSGCVVAGSLRRAGLSEYSFPLNWVITPLNSLFLLFENDFKDYFHKSHLLIKDRGHPGNLGVYDTVYDIHSRHDFLINKDFWSQYQDIKSKYERRVARLYRALSSKKKVYLFRYDIDKESSIKLYDLILKKFPNLDLTLVCVVKTINEGISWDLKKIKNYYIDRLHLTNVNSWKKIFEDCDLV
ncbi:MAG: DUF1796 family putative cysteine peptidase [Candidatus Babeliales bacterium]|nr:DUF1796 family putative cysteine peptidase [Candidatus Babeliales bacterium]